MCHLNGTYSESFSRERALTQNFNVAISRHEVEDAIELQMNILAPKANCISALAAVPTRDPVATRPATSRYGATALLYKKTFEASIQ